MERVHLASLLGRYFGKALVNQQTAIAWALEEIEAEHDLCTACGSCPRCDGPCQCPAPEPAP